MVGCLLVLALVVLGMIVCEAISLWMQDMGMECSRWAHECKMRGRVDLGVFVRSMISDTTGAGMTSIPWIYSMTWPKLTGLSEGAIGQLDAFSLRFFGDLSRIAYCSDVEGYQ